MNAVTGMSIGKALRAGKNTDMLKLMILELSKSSRRTGLYLAPQRHFSIKMLGADRYSVKLYYFDKNNPIYIPSIKIEKCYFDEFGNGGGSIVISEPRLLPNKIIKRPNLTLEELFSFIQTNL